MSTAGCNVLGRVGCRATWCKSGSLAPHKDRTSKHPTVLTRDQTMHEPMREMQHEQTVANMAWPHLPLGGPTAPKQSEPIADVFQQVHGWRREVTASMQLLPHSLKPPCTIRVRKLLVKTH